jgi:hypothetical protein
MVAGTPVLKDGEHQNTARRRRFVSAFSESKTIKPQVIVSGRNRL